VLYWNLTYTLRILSRSLNIIQKILIFLSPIGERKKVRGDYDR